MIEVIYEPIRTSDLFEYKWEDKCELTIRELEIPVKLGNGCSCKYAVGIETYGRNYKDEYVESPTLFFDIEHAQKHYVFQLEGLRDQHEVRFLEIDECRDY